MTDTLENFEHSVLDLGPEGVAVMRRVLATTNALDGLDPGLRAAIRDQIRSRFGRQSFRSAKQ